ncbi:ABC transporter ATP-binding protein [Thermodesulforhabdus norvegica]|uniref:Iron complex transport system ATP-binding protein n=1 Tax=Thermodesulforhabdus norvegica TaxID=39841 RepID=A0A1I4VEI2_9BACT|nr:ATP-binding cassette domain-containing protein [Thermodesulforhabdus norvegica]SFM99581.1 iron complex transport system ATP-binding protein [Thermodesulforhabdus norvegica]
MSVILRDVCFVRSGQKILSHITWEVQQGDRWVILGPNGSGKTTLLKLISGYIWPTSGTVEVLGKRFGTVDLRLLRRKIGWVGSFLQELIPPGQKVFDVIAGGVSASFGKVYGCEVPFDAVERWARVVQCDSLLDKPYGVLSQGEKQRVLLARALISEPDLLLLDEPCAGLDVVAREYFLKTLEHIAGRRKTMAVLLVTHHIEEVAPFFTGAVVMKAGRFIASGSSDRVLTDDILKEAFNVPVKVLRHNGRFALYCTVDLIRPA